MFKCLTLRVVSVGLFNEAVDVSLWLFRAHP